MNDLANRFQKVGLIDWYDHDYFGFGQVIRQALEELGCRVIPFAFDSPIPPGIDLLFSFGPFGPQVGRYLPVPDQLARLPKDVRPVYTHWNTELLPNPATPDWLLGLLSISRSWIDRLADSPHAVLRYLVRRPPLRWITQRMHRFRRVGDYLHAQQIAGIDVYAESSQVYTRMFRKLGLPAIYVPWGTSKTWYDDLHLQRDIDVLWMGRRGGGRRDRLLENIRTELENRKVNFYIADNVIHPAIIGSERTRFLNRAKITLNLEPTSYDNAFPYRFHTVAGNRSMVISEPVYPHCPEYQSGIHYVAAPPDQLAETVIRYLHDEQQRTSVIENAYSLVTKELRMVDSVRSILAAAYQRI